MKAKIYSRRPLRISGSTWRRILEIITQFGQFAPRIVARRAASRSGGEQ